MTENRQEGNLKLRLRTTDTSRFKTENPGASAEKPSFPGVSPNATVPTSQINDPVSSLNNSTGRLKKVTMNEETQASAISPMGAAGAGQKKNETVKLKVVKANAPAAPGPAAQSPLRLDDVNNASATPNSSSTSTGSLKLPKLGGLRLANATTSVQPPTPGTEAAAPAATDAPTTPGTVKPAVSTATAALKLPMRATLKRPTATAAVPEAAEAQPEAEATQVTAAPAPAGAEAQPEATQATAPPAPAGGAIRNTTTLKIRPVTGAKSTSTPSGSASATLKITPPGVARPAADGAAAPAASAPGGDSPLKQTGVKFSLKKSEDNAAAKTVTTPAPAAPAAGSGDAAATVAMPAPAAPAASGLKLKKDDAAATVAMPSPAGATAATNPPTEGGTKGKVVMTKAPKEKTEGDVMPSFAPEESDEPGKLQGICAIISFLALGAACYFIVMDFLKFVK